ncbi:MAG: flocculation-associated PEP-CTERM protein PepA [Methylobacter sp.]|nr:flocculation-associated PEP-CTERM protein PepA [Methylobacter sp.]
MKKLNTLNKTLLAAALTTGLVISSSNAMAANIFPDFNVQEGVVPGGTVSNLFTADKITGNYNEIVTFGAGTFDVSLKWNAGQYVADDGANPLTTQLGSFGAAGYGMYALFQASGTFTTVAGVSTFTFTPGGSLNLFLDPSANTKFTAAANGASAWGRSLFDDDVLIGTGAAVAGGGQLNPGLSTCSAGGGSGINCGSFGSTTSFALTDFGKTYFVSPTPFYNLAFESGQFNNFQVTGTQNINGSMDVVFGTAVPEPTTIALLGMGLIGFGFRRRNQA